MAYDASFEDWPETRWQRIRRWILRLLALLALVACGVGVYVIVREATEEKAPQAATLRAELAQMAGSHGALAARLAKLRPDGPTAAALEALDEARGDRATAAAALRAKREDGEVQAAAALAGALRADARYLAAVGRVLRNPEAPVAQELGARAKRAKVAFAKLPDDQGVGKAIKGARRLTAYAQGTAG
jgi:hypothetical protein